MNKIYRVVWNATLGLWQCVSELTPAKGKTKSSKKIVNKSKKITFILSTIISLLPVHESLAQVVAGGGVAVSDNNLYIGSIYNTGTITAIGISGLDQFVREVKAQSWSKGRTFSNIKLSVWNNDKPNGTNTFNVQDGTTISTPLIEVGATSHSSLNVLRNSSLNASSFTTSSGKNINIKVQSNSLLSISYGRISQLTLLVDNKSTFQLSQGQINNSSLKFTNNGAQLSNIAGNFNRSSLNLTNSTVKLINNSTFANSSSVKLNANATLDLTNGLTLTNSSLNLNGGTLAASETGTITTTSEAAPINLQADSTIDVAEGKTLTLDNKSVISGSSNLSKTGNGTLIFGADNIYTGATNVNAGTLQLGNGAATGDLATESNITLANDTTLALNHGANDYILDNAISGAGKLIQLADNSGTTTITKDSSDFTGNVEINAGILQVGDGGETGDIGNGTVTIASGAGLKINRSNSYNLDNIVTGGGVS
ncbi:hypothetical protein QV06_06930 [Gallibacterium genomosp. 3]|uniref:ESPR domain-containing protein n=1 Tax=Gallibacterium genomosp. 3 TaxID=505345 RepID=A0A1A7PRN9_9PAST|nr:ESPR domain-containing protein [Gallibacterium genomosp. 3]OBX04382.1 hypothetical protein QV06_06930 [Gallibacterium genomosp. 3]